MNNREVYANLKAMKPFYYMTEREKQAYAAKKKAWQEEFIADFVARNGYEPDDIYVKNEMNKAFPLENVVSLDAVKMAMINSDKSVTYDVTIEDQAENTCEACLHDLIRGLPERWQVIYDKALLQGQCRASIANELGMSRVSVEKVIQKIVKRIIQDKEISKFFRMG